MAEWTGQKRTLNSISAVDDLPLDDTAVHSPKAPISPGATDSPQRPGATPDTPRLPGKPRGSLRPLGGNRRPLTEYGTAQRLLRMFTPDPGSDLQPTDWEQGPSAFEEVRKANPSLLTPFRPLDGYGLGIGRAAHAIAPEESEAIAGADEPVPAVPAVVEPAPGTEVPAGAVRGDGSASCPPEFPVKGNAQSKLYHTPESRVYAQTIPEFCFSSAAAAEAAGFRPPREH
jgi:hypothetical protein